MDFIDAVALFHHDERMEITSEYPQKLLVAPADAWYGFKIFGEELVMSALNLKPLDRKMLHFLRTRPNQKYSAMDLQKEMGRPEYGENRAVSEIRQSLEDMIHKMYVERHEETPVAFSASPFGQSINVSEQAKLDWEKVVERAKEKARENLDPEDAEKYIRDHCEGSGLIVTHPITGETVNILEDTEYEEELDQAQEEVDEVMEEPMSTNWRDVRHLADEQSNPATTDGGEPTT